MMCSDCPEYEYGMLRLIGFRSRNTSSTNTPAINFHRLKPVLVSIFFMNAGHRCGQLDAALSLQAGAIIILST